MGISSNVILIHIYQHYWQLHILENVLRFVLIDYRNAIDKEDLSISQHSRARFIKPLRVWVLFEDQFGLLNYNEYIYTDRKIWS